MCMGIGRGVRIVPTVRFDAILVPKELEEIVEQFPEIVLPISKDGSARPVRIHSHGFAGNRIILSDVSIEALVEKVIPMIPEIGNREGSFVLMVERHGYCLTCQESSEPCMHLGDEVACNTNVHGWVPWDRILQYS